MATASSYQDAFPVLRPDEVLRREPADLFVEDGAEVNLTPQRRQHLSYFAHVRAKSFEDLQTLGLVPRGLREERVKEAIGSDDREALQMAREMVSRRSDAHPCGCGGSAVTASTVDAARAGPYRSPLTRTYAALRKEFNPALATLLSNHYRTTFQFDSVLAQSVRGWLSHAARLAAEAPLLVALFQDIRIGRGARLIVDPKCMSLYARGVYIHRTGTMVHKGANLRIWASVVSRYEDWATVLVDHHVPWTLTN